MDRWEESHRDFEPIPLPSLGPHSVEMNGFLGELRRPLDGQSSVMGCLQTSRFPVVEPPAAAASIERALEARYATEARQTHPSGRAGGFGYDAILACDRHGAVSRVEDGTSPEALDFSRVGVDLEWSMLRVDIHDFLAVTPLDPMIDIMAPRMPVAAYVVLHEDFGAPIEPSPSGTLAECRFGYAFLPCACEPSPLGFGPGRFGAGFKQFRFSLLQSGELEIRLSFVVAPRSRRVLNLRGFDPIYGSLRALDALTLGALKLDSRVHDAFDTYFLKLHGLVHHELLVRMKSLWARPSHRLPL